MPTGSPEFRFFVQIDLSRDHLEYADLFSSGVLLFVVLDLVRDRQKHADLLAPDFLFFIKLDAVRDRLTRAVLHSPGFMNLVQLDLVRRSPEACRLPPLTLNSTLCCVVFQCSHQSVAPPQGVPLRSVLHANRVLNVLKCDEHTLRWLTDDNNFEASTESL